MISRNVHAQLEFQLKKGIEEIFADSAQLFARNTFFVSGRTTAFPENSALFGFLEERVQIVVDHAIADTLGELLQWLDEYANSWYSDSFHQMVYYKHLSGLMYRTGELIRQVYPRFLVAYGTYDAIQAQDLRNAYNGHTVENAQQWITVCLTRMWPALMEYALERQKTELEIFVRKMQERASYAQ